MELYKKFRPKSLEQIVGNRTTVSTLQTMLRRKTLPHTILFSGPSGCGKTTLARILKTELECGQSDYREMNCSDTRGIDTIREIASVMNLAPIGGKCRIFLLDEVHQLTGASQNSALKILEDTPKHVYFFLCTTHPQKLIKTILNRCTKMPVAPLENEEVETLVTRVVDKLGPPLSPLSQNNMDDIVDAAEGSARNALVLLDKVRNLTPKQRKGSLRETFDEEKEAIELCRALIKKAPWKDVAAILKGLPADDVESTRWAVLGYARSVLLSHKNEQAYLILRAFENNFFDSKAAGLARACFEAVFGE